MFLLPSCRLKSLISIDDDDGSENVNLWNELALQTSSRLFQFTENVWGKANFPGVDFLETALKFRKRKKNSSSIVYVLHKT